MVSGVVTKVKALGRPMYCIDCRKQFIHIDLDRPQPAMEGVYLNCDQHKNPQKTRMPSRPRKAGE